VVTGPSNLFLYCSYDKAKQRYARNREGKLSPGLHLASAAEAGALVSEKIPML